MLQQQSPQGAARTEIAHRLRLGFPSSSGRSGAAATASFRKSRTASECTNALLRVKISEGQSTCQRETAATWVQGSVAMLSPQGVSGSE